LVDRIHAGKLEDDSSLVGPNVFHRQGSGHLPGVFHKDAAKIAEPIREIRQNVCCNFSSAPLRPNDPGHSHKRM
jgi:hypothetical protein